MKISVIIPSYNRLSRLRKAIESVLAQKGPSFELIVIDDGSTDGTREMVQSGFRQVRYFYQENQGPASARNLGIQKAEGEWIAFLDSDDLWQPGKLQAQIEFNEIYPDYLIHQTNEIWVRNGVRVNPMKKHEKKGGFIFKDCLKMCIVSPSAVMIKKSLFDEVGLFDENFPACEDYELWLRIAARHPIGLLDAPYVTKFGGHADQRSHEFPAMDKFRIDAIIKLLSSGILDGIQNHDARNELQKKVFIYTSGAMKRGKSDEVERMRGLISSL